MIKVILVSIAAINIFSAGRCFEQDYNNRDSIKEKLKTCLVCLIFAIGYVGFYLIVAIAGFIYQDLWKGLHLDFIWLHFVLRKPLEFSNQKHKIVMNKAKSLNPKWYQFGDRIYIRLVQWIDRKNKPK